MTSPSGGYTSGRSTPTRLRSYNIYNVGNSSARIVTRPVAQGRYAAEFQVLPTTGTNPNDRAEIVASQAESGGYPGQTWWYGWWTYFPGPSQDWWRQGGDWNDITQFFSTDNVPSQMAIGIDATHRRSPVIYAEGMPFRRKRILATASLRPLVPLPGSRPLVDRFERLRGDVARREAGNPARLRRNVEKPELTGELRFTSPGMYLSQGIYRHAYRSTNTVIHDGFCRASRRRLAEPKAPPRAPETARASATGQFPSRRLPPSFD